MISRCSHRNTNLPINTVTTKLLFCCSWNTKCAVQLRRHHPSAGHNKPSGGNREWCRHVSSQLQHIHLGEGETLKTFTLNASVANLHKLLPNGDVTPSTHTEDNFHYHNVLQMWQSLLQIMPQSTQNKHQVQKCWEAVTLLTMPICQNYNWNTTWAWLLKYKYPNFYITPIECILIFSFVRHEISTKQPRPKT